MSDTNETELIFDGGSDVLQLEDGGKEYHPGDPMPKNLSHVKRAALQRAGIRFTTRHHEPDPAETEVAIPELKATGDRAPVLIAEKNPEGLVAAVEAAPAEESKPRRAVKES